MCINLFHVMRIYGTAVIHCKEMCIWYAHSENTAQHWKKKKNNNNIQVQLNSNSAQKDLWLCENLWATDCTFQVTFIDICIRWTLIIIYNGDSSPYNHYKECHPPKRPWICGHLLLSILRHLNESTFYVKW